MKEVKRLQLRGCCVWELALFDEPNSTEVSLDAFNEDAFN